MRNSLISLILVFSIYCGQETKWTEYTSEHTKVKISYPSEWYVDYESEDKLILSTVHNEKQSADGNLVLPENGLAVQIFLTDSCEGLALSNDYLRVQVGYGFSNLRRKFTCKDGIAISTVLWDKDPKMEEHIIILERIRNSIRAFS